MPFTTAEPVTGNIFFDRKGELTQLLSAARDLMTGTLRYYAILGLRKVGKSSLLQEFRRRACALPVAVVYLDCFESALDINTFLEDLAIVALDEYCSKTGCLPGLRPLVTRKYDETEFHLALGQLAAQGNDALTAAARAILTLRSGKLTRDLVRVLLDIPALLSAEALPFIVILDEFQELAKLNASKLTQEIAGDIFKLLRSRWQTHKGVTYFISGSELSMMDEIINREGAALFQHFNTITLAEFPRAEALEMLTTLFSQAGRSLAPELLEKMVTLLNGHPFYLQVLGEELCRATLEIGDPIEEGTVIPVTEALFKEVFQETLFRPSGRLFLYFEGYFERFVGRAPTLQQVLFALAEGNASVTRIAHALSRPAGTISSWLGRLARMGLVKKEGHQYTFTDPVFGLWLKGTKSPAKRTLAPSILGDLAEKAVADSLGAEGFTLIYQSRASRGAFDLFVMLEPSLRVGIQVKSAGRFPFYIQKEEIERMLAWGKRLGWIPVLCLYDSSKGAVSFYSASVLGARADEERESRAIRIDEGDAAAQRSLLKLLGF